jgi:DNA-binding IclR family transcriptional regulator
MSEVLKKAFTLLQLLKPKNGIYERSSKELADLSGFNTATTHRILQDLESHELVHQNLKTKKYYLGSSLIELGLSASNFLSIRDLAKESMEKIAAETNESVYLNVLTGNNTALLLDSIDSAHNLRVVEPLGLRLPLHIGATRRVILAFMDPVYQQKYMEECDWGKRTENTITNRSDLEADIKLIQDRGYAISYGETSLGTAGIATPIFGRDGVEASLGIATPKVRLDPKKIPEWINLLQVNAKTISEQMRGY